GPEAFAPEFRADLAETEDDAGRLRVVVDQVASLTDASALAWHARLTGRR
ncbi:MAG TPA: deoxyguanosinetriphosphate triphosphohydrolase, partial [Mycobacteriales bacterium]|nr:deoxyguanosinetriphosphate triphosphohydrolase [Mycobacteriales bacterium]